MAAASGDGARERAARRIPHFALQTITASQPEYANHEQDMIRQSFSAGNHTWMKEALPVDLGPDAVNFLRRQRMERSRLAEPVPQTWSKMTQLWGGGYYQEFEYMPDEYDRRNAALREGRQGSVEKREKIANHDWRYASQEKRMKHEAMIGDSRQKESYPYLGGNKEEELEASKQWLRTGSLSSRASGATQGKEQPRAAGAEASFLAGKGRGLEDNSRTSRMTLPMIIQRLQKRVEVDWEGTTVVVSATDQDLVQVAFHMATVDSERGVLAYMGVLSKDVDLLGSLGLRKVSQLWGMKRDFAADLGVTDAERPEAMFEHTWIFFLLMPKWVRMRPTDAYYTVHPRSQGSAFRMSTAGSSVLLSLGSSVIDPVESSVRRKEAPRGSDALSSARGSGEFQLRRSGGANTTMPTQERGPMEMSLIEKAIASLPSIREGRGAAE